MPHDKGTESRRHIESAKPLGRRRVPKFQFSKNCDRYATVEVTYDRKTVLINPRIGMNVVLVRLLASENRNVVADETGVA
jgi:hypothetical protein